MSPREIIRTALAIRLQSGGGFGASRAAAEEVVVPLLEADDDDAPPRLVQARVAVWSERGQLRGELLDTL
jgi:hypothetical protein